MKAIFTLLALANVIGCSTINNTSKKAGQPAIARSYLVGTWYNERQLSNGVTEEKTLENFDDGTYRITLKSTYKGGYTANNLELGQWGLSGDIYFTIARGTVEGCSIVSTDRQAPDTYNAYTIDELSEARLAYHPASGHGRRSQLTKAGNDVNLTGDNPALDGCSYISKSSSKRPSRA